MLDCYRRKQAKAGNNNSIAVITDCIKLVTKQKKKYKPETGCSWRRPMSGFLVSFNWQADYIKKVVFLTLFHFNLDCGT